MRLYMVKRGIKTGFSASVASTLALGMLGTLEAKSALQPINAISHWIWGDNAYKQTGFSLRYTVTGYAIHHASSTFWAMIYEKIHEHRQDKQENNSTTSYQALSESKSPTIAYKALKMAALAAYTDYQLTPRRLRPGYEVCLSKPGLTLVYLAFAAGLAQRELKLRQLL
jgi:hypothetical protein